MARLPWRDRLTRRSQRLLQAAGIDPRSLRDIAEPDICRYVAYRVTQRGGGRVGAVLAAAEELLADEANYGFVIAFLEDVQNLDQCTALSLGRNAGSEAKSIAASCLSVAVKCTTVTSLPGSRPERPRLKRAVTNRTIAPDDWPKRLPFRTTAHA